MKSFFFFYRYLMKLLRLSSQKGVPFQFLLQIETLSPWPFSDGPLVIQWQRGSKRHGQTKVADPTEGDMDMQSELTGTYVFDDTIKIPATMYRDPQSPDGYKSKLLSLFVARVDKKGKEISVNGGLELDLNDFVSIQGKVRQEYPIECSTSVRETIGARPKLNIIITVVRGHEKAVSGATEETTSLDDLPSTLSTEDEENYIDEIDQEHAAELASVPENSLIESHGSVGGPPRAAALAAEAGFQNDYTKEYDSDGFLIDSHDITGDNHELVTSGLDNGDGEAACSTTKAQHARKLSRDGMRNWTWHKSSNSAIKRLSEHNEDGENQIYSDTNGQENEYAIVDEKATYAAESAPGHGEHLSRERGNATNLSEHTAQRLESNSQVVKNLERELHNVAALEHSVYNLGWKSNSGSDIYATKSLTNLQSSSRRIARTILMLGKEEGVAFGLEACKAIRNSALGSSNDISHLSFWWSTAIMLRFSFWCLATGGSTNQRVEGTHLRWIQDSLDPAYRDLEEMVFHLICDYLWKITERCLSNSNEALNSHSQSPKTGSNKPFGTKLAKSLMKIHLPLDRKHNLERENSKQVDNQNFESSMAGAVEECLSYLEELDMFLRSDAVLVPSRLHSLFRKFVMANIVERMDEEILASLLFNGNKGHKEDKMPAMDISPKSLSFESGVALKMNASRMSSWCIQSGIYKGGFELMESDVAWNEKSDSCNEEKSKEIPFRRMRGLADLIMAPKASLLDPEVRKTVAFSLKPSDIYVGLKMYSPDHGTKSDKVPESLLHEIKSEIASSNRTGIKLRSDGRWSHYWPPSETFLLEESLIEPLMLDLSTESEDELEELEERHSGQVNRFALLHQLWQPN